MGLWSLPPTGATMADKLNPGDPTGCTKIRKGPDGSNANAGKAGPLCPACGPHTDGKRAHCPRCGACLERRVVKGGDHAS